MVAVQVLLTILMSCDQASTETAIKKDMHLCHDVGSYCSTTALFFCWGHTEGYCCFSTLLSRIIQEGARAQLGIGWGDPRPRTAAASRSRKPAGGELAGHRLE